MVDVIVFFLSLRHSDGTGILVTGHIFILVFVEKQSIKFNAGSFNYLLSFIQIKEFN